MYSKIIMFVGVQDFVKKKGGGGCQLKVGRCNN